MLSARPWGCHRAFCAGGGGWLRPRERRRAGRGGEGASPSVVLPGRPHPRPPLSSAGRAEPAPSSANAREAAARTKLDDRDKRGDRGGGAGGGLGANHGGDRAVGLLGRCWRCSSSRQMSNERVRQKKQMTTCLSTFLVWPSRPRPSATRRHPLAAIPTPSYAHGPVPVLVLSPSLALQAPGRCRPRPSSPTDAVAHGRCRPRPYPPRDQAVPVPVPVLVLVAGRCRLFTFQVFK